VLGVMCCIVLQSFSSTQLVAVRCAGCGVLYSPAEFQFYTCSAAFLFHLPASLFLLDEQQAAQITSSTALLMFINGLLYHCQTMMAFTLMQFLSPLTHR